MRKNIFICWISFWALSMGGCIKVCNSSDYSFSVSENFAPEKDSVVVGDTIWIICKINKTLFDNNSKKIVTYSGINNLSDYLIMSDISKFRSSQRNCEDSFAYVSLEGKIYSDSKGSKQLSFMETDSSYQLKVGLIALKKGIYGFTFPDAPFEQRNGCGNVEYKILNSNKNNHTYIFDNFLGSAPSPSDSAHSYFVKVI